MKKKNEAKKSVQKDENAVSHETPDETASELLEDTFEEEPPEEDEEKEDDFGEEDVLEKDGFEEKEEESDDDGFNRDFGDKPADLVFSASPEEDVEDTEENFEYDEIGEDDALNEEDTRPRFRVTLPDEDEKIKQSADEALKNAASFAEASEKIGVEEKPEESSEEGTEYRKIGLYIHVPFCRSKCAYCDFYSTDKIVCRGHKIPEDMKRYVTSVKNHMKVLSERTTEYNVDTVFIGGGTPTALAPKLLLDLVREVERDYYMEEGYEFTVEMNPATANASLLRALRKAGVNRLSIGLQSSHNHELAALSRIHTVGDFTEAFQMAREAGFDNINVDVMYGIPEQTEKSFMETLSFVCGMKPEHISMYNLRIEDGTPFGEKQHMLPLPDEDAECAMYFDGIEYLASMGYHQYEISNFARDGYECRHNLRYWHGEEYLGFGPAAHSYFCGSRFSFRRSLSLYVDALEKLKEHQLPKSLLDENYRIDRKEEVAEYMMLRFRLCEGISVEDFKNRFDADFDAIFGKRLQVYIDNDFMRHEDGRYFFTPKGMFVSNYILSRIIPFEPRFAAGTNAN